MCILPDNDLATWASSFGVRPYDKECINPASIDLRWSGRVRYALPKEGLPCFFKGEDGTLFWKNIKTESGWSDIIDVESFEFVPGEFYLLDTLEYIKMPVYAAGELCLKSSMGRLGLEHLHAGYVDPGFCGTLTLEIKVMSPWAVTLKRGQRIVQLIMHRLASEPSKPYQGRYNGQMQPTEARV